jgi:hypothetical protein
MPPLLGAPVCASMPSAIAARDFMAGRPGALAHMLVSYAGRTAIIAAGMYASGKREHLTRDAAAGAAVIEIALLTYFGFPKNQATDQVPSQHNLSQFLNGNMHAGIRVGIDVALRTLEISSGMAFVGQDPHRFRHALAGSLAVELFILSYLIAMGKPCPS